jgi:hypothetical protein
LLSTEAGAEGLNLQFCNLVVNYDLPWNPQRIEQRIGRCHRYGQQRDVLVLNFLNRRNAADARLYELLEQKLSLFDGVLGASDEILGALESGVDFEKRVLDIYQSCRSPEQIDTAFATLRADLESRIDRRMTEARSLLLERFDGDVRRRLRVAGDQIREAIARRGQEARALTRSVLGAESVTRAQVEMAAATVRGRAGDTVSYLALDAATLPSRLSSLAGAEGWWFAYRFETTGLEPADRIVHLVLVREPGGGYRVLPLTDSEVFPRLAASEELSRKPPPLSVAVDHERALLAARDESVRQAERSGAAQLDKSRELADRYAEDCLLEPRELVEKSRAKWEQARAAVKAEQDLVAKVRVRAHAERTERDYRKLLSSLRLAEEQRYSEKDRGLAALATRAKVTLGRSMVASAYFWIT